MRRFDDSLQIFLVLLLAQETQQSQVHFRVGRFAVRLRVISRDRNKWDIESSSLLRFLRAFKDLTRSAKARLTDSEFDIFDWMNSKVGFWVQVDSIKFDSVAEIKLIFYLHKLTDFPWKFLTSAVKLDLRREDGSFVVRMVVQTKSNYHLRDRLRGFTFEFDVFWGKRQLECAVFTSTLSYLKILGWKIVFDLESLCDVYLAIRIPFFDRIARFFNRVSLQLPHNSGQKRIFSPYQNLSQQSRRQSRRQERRGSMVKSVEEKMFLG